VNLSNKTFKLIENKDGLAASNTIMAFNGNNSPYIATYTGINVQYGNVMVTTGNNGVNMIYHAFTSDNELVAGKASVYLSQGVSNKLNMKLHWQWLTGDLSAGISHWVELDALDIR
jgi:hypothetical protein